MALYKVNIPVGAESTRWEDYWGRDWPANVPQAWKDANPSINTKLKYAKYAFGEWAGEMTEMYIADLARDTARLAISNNVSGVTGD